MAIAFGDLTRSGFYGSGLHCVCQSIALRTTGVHDTGFDFVSGDLIQDVFVRIRTAESTGTTKTIDVGLLASETLGDEDGFIDGLSTATAGTIRPGPTITVGSNTTYYAGAQGAATGNTVGVLMANFEVGTDVDKDEGLYQRKYAPITTAVSLTYTLGSAATEVVGEIYVVFWRPQS